MDGGVGSVGGMGESRFGEREGIVERPGKWDEEEKLGVEVLV